VNDDGTVTVPRPGNLSTQFTGVSTLLALRTGIPAFVAALFRGPVDRPDVEYSEVIEEGEDGEDADRSDHIFVVGAKAAALFVHRNSLFFAA
jgi:hypothetical protein